MINTRVAKKLIFTDKIIIHNGNWLNVYWI